MTMESTAQPRVSSSVATLWPRPDNVVRLHDGRLLGYGEYGAATGYPVIFFHGMPGSRLEGKLAHESASRQNVRLIAPDRPGYGLSDFKPKRRILDWADDVLELADALGIDRFAIAGISGGGPYVAACAWRIPKRLTGAVIISGVGPFEAPGATEGMSRQNRALFGMARRVPPLARALLSVMGTIATRWPQRFIGQMKRAMPAPDRAVLERDGNADTFAEDMRESFRCGSRGAAWEAQLYARPWGFRLEDIAMEVHLWQGGEDVNVAPSMGRYQAQAIPNAKLSFYEHEGHLLGITHLDEIFSTITSRVNGI
jgi:pimeloyl-ACP methyl ester carboxylesterase